ncbi:solute carrier family 12 member 8-like [Gigantopelta aegis]|uniref:solute carrier family 12 member 8-like n=1 Tax=Gigantopelta aegis TaxID=1735272 RepID=UPI001B88E5A8|nr:solute carrier family 12 member 8-like [Gigantopelta aegis]XP_041361290.1 solute carrier family 12 member 8-like [Gigantopelta aegis]
MAAQEESEKLMAVGTTKKKPDWSRFGLSAEQQKESEKNYASTVDSADGGYHGDPGRQNEIFREDQNVSKNPWWKSNFFISEPILFGTWDGVFTSCLINILGVVIFLRMGWIVGNAGISLSILTVVIAVAIVLMVALSAVGVCERCRMESGGVYFLISHVLGGRIGGSIGVIYCFAQSVSCSLGVMGFGESIMELIGQSNPWIARAIAVGVVLLLLVINVAGVKWVIRLQLILLLVLFLSCMDLVVGSFVHVDPENGVTGYSEFNFLNNSGPNFIEGENFFSIFGLFFSTVTGILAGINMSGDLKDPFHNIPKGTLAALSFSTFLYIAFILVLGSTCTRSFLLGDYMIAEKVSIVGVLWLAGLYLSSVSACMGSLYGPPRILQSIANEKTIPIIRVLGHGRGPNKVPVYALIVITIVVLLFICVGNVNTLAPVVTTAFMITYAAIDYSYFVLAMSYDRRQEREDRFSQNLTKTSEYGRKSSVGSDLSNGTLVYGSSTKGVDTATHKDSFQKLASDLDKLFPERLSQRGQHHLVRQSSFNTGSNVTTPEADFDATKRKLSADSLAAKGEDVGDTAELLGAKKQPNTEITQQPRSWYSFFCNRWISLFGTVSCLVIMFTIQWMYALGELLAFFVVYFYIGKASPGYFPGIAEFNFYEWMKHGFRKCCRIGPTTPEQIIVAPKTPAVQTLAAQLTCDNEDFASRGRYHQTEVVQGQHFDNYDSD